MQKRSTLSRLRFWWTTDRATARAIRKLREAGRNRKRALPSEKAVMGTAKDLRESIPMLNRYGLDAILPTARKKAKRRSHTYGAFDRGVREAAQEAINARTLSNRKKPARYAEVATAIKKAHIVRGDRIEIRSDSGNSYPGTFVRLVDGVVTTLGGGKGEVISIRRTAKKLKVGKGERLTGVILVRDRTGEEFRFNIEHFGQIKKI